MIDHAIGIYTDMGCIPDLASRYFEADFSNVVSIIQQVGKLARVKTPIIDTVMDWYQSIAVIKDGFSFMDYGIIDREFKEMLSEMRCEH